MMDVPFVTSAFVATDAKLIDLPELLIAWAAPSIRGWMLSWPGVALTISDTIESFDPVHWYVVPRSLLASSAPYWVGVKNGLVVTWQTKTNFHFGVLGKLPIPAAACFCCCPQAVSRADAASDALASPVPVMRRRRVTGFRSRVSTASSTFGCTFRMVTSHRGVDARGVRQVPASCGAGS